MNNPNARSIRRPLLLIAATLAIFACMSLVVSPLRGYAYTGTPATTTTYPMQSSIQYSFVQERQTADSYIQVTVSAWANNPKVFPSYVNVFFWATFKGETYVNHGCELYYRTGQSSQSCSFRIPFKSSGDYGFYATFYSGQTVVAKAIADPLIEPEWK